MTSTGPCVLVSIPHGAAAGNMVRTGILRRVLDAQPTARLVVVSPLVKDPAFTQELAGARVSFEDLPAHVPTGLEARLFALMQASYVASGATESVRIRFEEAVANKTMRWIRTKRLLTRIGAPSMARKGSRYDVVDRLVSHPHAEALFERHRPDLVVTSSPGLIFSEVPLLRTAARRGVRAMAIDPSWDNFTNKLIPVRRVNRLIVWNDLMREQAIGIHGYQPDEIRVAGCPQWDLYFADRRADRDAFFKRIGADPSRALVTLTTTPRPIFSHHDHVLRVLIAAMRSGAWGRPAQILVRIHPRDEASTYDGFRGEPNVIVEKPFRPTIRSGDGLEVDVTASAQQHLADTLAHSDVIINVASTIGIEAAIFDTPVVNISFDGETPSEWVRSSRRYYNFTHYVNVTRHDSVRVAETPAQLADFVGRYLADPALDREGRRAVKMEQCRFVDGRSAERVASFVAAEIADVCGLAPSITPSCAESLVSSR